MQQIFVDREYDFSAWGTHHRAVTDFYDDCLRRSKVPVIVDGGANIGLSSVWFAQRFPRSRIFAVEPEPGNFSILNDNAARYPNIEPVNACILDHETAVSLANDTDAPWTWEVKEGGTEIGAVTIPSLLEREPNGVAFIVKLDIEGSEVDVFRSNVEWIKQTPMIVIETHDWLSLGEELLTPSCHRSSCTNAITFSAGSICSRSPIRI